MAKTFKDSDILHAMTMMVDYESVVYGFDGKYYLRSSYLIDGEDVAPCEEAAPYWKNKDVVPEDLHNCLWLYW